MDPFEDLYHRYYADVYRFALFLTSDRTNAEDLAADTFVRAWTARDRIRQDTVRAYLLTITRNLYRDGLRSASGRQFTAVDDTIADPRAHVQMQQISAFRHLQRRLGRVARGDRRALLLYVVKEMSYEEIAETLGVTLSAVKSRIRRAREVLKSSAPGVTPDPSHKESDQ
jgi:RNA polymerase sigma-70 factor (ECF subfamily)